MLKTSHRCRADSCRSCCRHWGKVSLTLTEVYLILYTKACFDNGHYSSFVEKLVLPFHFTGWSSRTSFSVFHSQILNLQTTSPTTKYAVFVNDEPSSTIELNRLVLHITLQKGMIQLYIWSVKIKQYFYYSTCCHFDGQDQTCDITKFQVTKVTDFKPFTWLLWYFFK